MADESAPSIYSIADSGFYSASDCSTPPTPSLQRGHFRSTSSASSLSSSPPIHEPAESLTGAAKLPQLTEEPVEREYEYGSQSPYRCSCHVDVHSPECRIAKAYHLETEYFTFCDIELRKAKRRRSLGSSARSITGKFERRFPSISRRAKDRNSKLSKTSRSTTPSMIPSTRSSSIAGSIGLGSTTDLTEEQPPLPTPTAMTKALLVSQSSIPVAIDQSNAMHADEDEHEARTERYATTPLLPPLMLNTRNANQSASSPLQSPAVADRTHPLPPTPVDTPNVRAYPTPSLASKPSVGSFKASRPVHTVASADIPPMMLADPSDKWVNLLGHANFTILPEPYIPTVCSVASVQQHFDDWVQAQTNYARHLVRTAEHYGATSKYFQLTEQKWAEIHAHWKQHHDVAKSHVAATGQGLGIMMASEPCPFSPINQMPALNDPKSEGKFPKLGDEDIVGPMQQAAAIHPTSPSRKRAFIRFFSDLLPRTIKSH